MQHTEDDAVEHLTAEESAILLEMEQEALLNTMQTNALPNGAVSTEMTPAAALPAVDTWEASAVEDTVQTTLQAGSDEHVALDGAETEATAEEKADGEHMSEETVVAALEQAEPPSISSADAVDPMSNDGSEDDEPRETHARSGTPQEKLLIDAVHKDLIGMGFCRCDVKGDGNCLLLSIMAGAEITCEEAEQASRCALDKVALLRRGAIDVLASDVPLDGISRAVFWAGERLPASSESVRKEMEEWTNMCHWRTEYENRGSTFILSVSMFLGRPVFVISREGMHYIHKSRVYGDREDTGELKKSIAKAGEPQTIPTFKPIDTLELLNKLEHLLDTSRQQQGRQSVITVIEHNGTNHFDAWVAPSREVAVGDRVRVTAEQPHGRGGWATFTGMVAPISSSINVDALNNILVGTDGGAWRSFQRSQVHKEIMLPNEDMLAPVVRAFTMRKQCATGMLLGYEEELVLGGSAHAYHAHIVCPNVDELETGRTRRSANGEHHAALRTYRTGDWVMYSQQGPCGEQITAAVVRIVAKPRTSTEQARNMLILLGTVPHEHENVPTLFLGAPGEWHRMVPHPTHDGAKLNIDSVETPVLRLSNDEISMINKTFVDNHVKDLPTSLSRAVKIAYSKAPPMLTALQLKKVADDKKQVNAKKAEAARAQAASKKSLDDASTDGRGKRQSRSSDATSTTASRDGLDNSDGPEHSKKLMVQQGDGAHATGRSAPRRTSTAAVRAGTNSERKEARADANIVEDVVDMAKHRATQAVRDAEKAQAELDISKAEAKRLNAIAQKAQADAEIARAQIAIAEAEQIKATAASMQSARERHTTVHMHADGSRDATTNSSPGASSHGGDVSRHWTSLFDTKVSPHMSEMHHIMGTPQRAETSSEPSHTTTSSAGPTSTASMHAPSLPSTAQHGVGMSMSTPYQPDDCRHNHGMPTNNHMPTMRQAPSSYWMPSPSDHMNMQPHDWTRGAQPFVSSHQTMPPTGRHYHEVHSPTQGNRHNNHAQMTTPPEISALRRDVVAARAAAIAASTAGTSQDFAARQSLLSVLTFDLARMEREFREKNLQTRPRSWSHY